MNSAEFATEEEMDDGLVEIAVALEAVPLNDAAMKWIGDARARERQVNCFDFVPSNYENAWTVLSNLPRTRFCEFGSGMGVVTGLASILGYEACGIELDLDLAAQSGRWLSEYNLDAQIECGSYFELTKAADVYYVYAWPGQQRAVKQRFLAIAPAGAKLLFCYGQDDLRIMMRSIDKIAQ